MQTGEQAATPQRIGVPREIFPGEKRVATVPDVVGKLTKLGFSVVVEQGAGELADLSDAAYIELARPSPPTRPRCGAAATSSLRCVRPPPTKWR